MISLRANSADEEKISEIKKLLCCGAFYFSWSPNPEVNPPMDLTLAQQKVVRSKETDNRLGKAQGAPDVFEI